MPSIWIFKLRLASACKALNTDHSLCWPVLAAERFMRFFMEIKL
jgi:hypothetical protein